MWTRRFSDGKYRKSLLQCIDTFFLFFNVKLRFGRADNLFYVEKNLIKIRHVSWKHFLVFSGRSIQADYEYVLAMATSLIYVVRVSKVWSVTFRVFIGKMFSRIFCTDPQNKEAQGSVLSEF